jgi:peptide/nickel transport system substrate-binding protein
MALPRLPKLSRNKALTLKFARNRALKLRFRRQLRLQKKQVEELGAQAEQRLEDDFFKRLERLGVVRRFVSTWLLLVVLLTGAVIAQIRGLSGYYQVLAAAPGGTYTEGVLGAFTNANPIYATSLADTTVSELVFAGLLTYDNNNELVGDLAESWTLDEPGTTYTFTLKPDLTWHDGQALTAHDVAFTFSVAQNPDARSPLFTSWSSISVTAADDRTVVFKLPNPLASFPYSLTTGIVPKHILGNVPMASMRTISFNTTQPVGAGPFQWQALELSGGSADTRQEQVALKAFDNYHAGKPKLNGFVVRTFRDAEQLVESFQEQEVSSITGLNHLPDSLQHDSTVRVYQPPLTAAVMAFFHTQGGQLADASLRQALVAAADRSDIIGSLPYPAKPVRQPILRGQVGHDVRFDQPGYNQTAAAEMLNAQGWAAGQDGIRTKDGRRLSLNMYFLDNQEYALVADKLAKQWQQVGVEIKLIPQKEADLRGVLSQAPAQGASVYDILLYGISIGADPDVYVFWHSSQTDLRSPVRLNFSEYKSHAADIALEAGRTRLDPALRAVKYQPFLQAWQSDAPALALYQPRFLYITRGVVHGLEERPINTDAGRLRNAHNWMIREQLVTPTE